MPKTYTQSWMPHDERLKIFYKDIDLFLEKYLVSQLSDDEIESLSAKVISDPLIGYIHLKPVEVFLIDTPLFRRLKNIRQLGLADMVFPSLSYSRFEHSIGVLGRLNQVLNKIQENNYKFKEDNLYDVMKKYKTPIRLAALLHDIGHCIFSHCSERVINSMDNLTLEIRQIFTEHFDKKTNIPFAELFTIAIIGSKRFYDFIDNSALLKERKDNLKNLLEQTVRFILGLPHKNHPDSIFLAQLMSGGLDVDKIDYMMREQHYTGIHLQIDLERILIKLQVFKIKYYELPRQLEYLKDIYTSDQDMYILGFAKGGQFAFEEFCIARLGLHVKIYLHQKLRTAESQLESYLKELLEIEYLKNPVNWLYLTEDIIKYPKCVINELDFNIDLFNQKTLKDETIQNLKKIDNRELFIRAFAFGQTNSLTKTKSSEIEKDELYFKKFKIEEIKQRITIETKNILKQLDIKEIDFENIIIDIPRLLNIQQGQESLYFERVNNTPVKWTIPIDKIMNYFQENRALGYVFSSKQLAPYVCLASEKVFYDLYNERFEQKGSISANIFKQYDKYKDMLNKKSFYSMYPSLKPISKELQTAKATEQISKIYENLASFKSHNDERITRNNIITFVNQFDVELQDAVVSFLENLKVYSESLLQTQINHVLESIGEITKIGLAYLGGESGSGGKLQYYLRETIETRYNKEIQIISESLIKESNRLLIFDDNINSGNQLINIIGELLNEKEKIEEGDKLDEKHIYTPLSNSDVIAKLKEIDIHFVFIVGFDGIEKILQDKLNKYFGFNKEKIHVSVYETFKNDKKIFSGGNSTFVHKDKDKLQTKFEEIAKELLLNEHKEENKINKRKLGYSNAEAMVLFPYNVPTMTITALWCKGKLLNGVPWIPLAERRRRQRNGNFIGED